MLRGRLQEMTEVTDVSRHPQLLMQLTRYVQNSIRILESEYPIKKYNCVMHAFNFTKNTTYIKIASSHSWHIFAGASFMHWLIDRSYLTEVPQGSAGDLVLYFSRGNFKHIGTVGDRARITSKWGIGHLYEHEVLEVPSSYGDEVRFYSALSCADAYNYFVEFAEEKKNAV